MVSPAPGTITSIDSQRLHGSQREATELRAQAASVDDAKPSSSKTSTEPRIEHKNKARQLLSSFWRRQVAVTVSHEDCRDHFGKHLALFDPMSHHQRLQRCCLEITAFRQNTCITLDAFHVLLVPLLFYEVHSTVKLCPIMSVRYANDLQYPRFADAHHSK